MSQCITYISINVFAKFSLFYEHEAELRTMINDDTNSRIVTLFKMDSQSQL
jgi:hypothetical protein